MSADTIHTPQAARALHFAFKAIRKIYPNARRVEITDTFKPFNGWNADRNDFTAANLATLARQGCKAVALHLKDAAGVTVGYPDFQLSELIAPETQGERKFRVGPSLFVAAATGERS